MKSISKLLVLIGVVGMLFACATSPITTPDVEHELHILHTNDHHGHPVAFFNYPAPDQGGLPAQATLMRNIRAENENVLVLSAGDINTGRPESNFFNAEPDFLGHNYIGYDAMTMGNHEFDPKPEVMQEQIAQSDFPWLCANVVKEDGSYIDNVKPYIIKDYGKFKVAIFGMMTSKTAESGNPAHIKGYTFRDEVEVAQELVPELEKQADIVVGLFHIGLYDSIDEGSKRVVANVPGIDVVIDGHTHTKTEEPVMVKNKVSGKDVPILMANQWGLHVGHIDLNFMNGEVTKLDFELIPINEKTKEGDEFKFVGQEIKKDEALKAKLQPFVDKVDKVLNEKIGTATDPFLNESTRKQETPIGNIVSDSMHWYANKVNHEADFAFQNGGGIRTDIPEGTIRKETIYEVLPFDNSVMTVTLKGSDVIKMFERTPETVTHGAMPQVSEGVSFEINTEKGTISNLTIDGEPVDPNKEYTVATNSYLAAGGDGYDMFNNKISQYDTSMMQRDVFIEYVIEEKDGKISPKVHDRYKVK